MKQRKKTIVDFCQVMIYPHQLCGDCDNEDQYMLVLLLFQNITDFTQICRFYRKQMISI